MNKLLQDREATDSEIKAAEKPPKSFVDRSQSFVPWLVRLAEEREIPKEDLAEIFHVGPKTLNPYYLKKYIGRDFMTIKQAEEAIERVAPELAVRLRKAKGYPEMLADDFMHDFIDRHPENKRLQLLKEKRVNFGPVYRLYRKQRSVGGKMLEQADCRPPDMSLNTLSLIERDKRPATFSEALDLISKFGFKPNKSGFESFCRKAADILRAYLIRKQEFNRALFIHLYPNGNTRQCWKVRQGITQEIIAKELGCSVERIMFFLRDKGTPTEDQATKTSALFGYRNENDFYKAAQRKYREKPQITLPSAKRSDGVAQFGHMIRLMREEVGLPRDIYDELVARIQGLENRGKKDFVKTKTTDLEGNWKLKLSPEAKMVFVRVFGIKDLHSFRVQATTIELLRDFRAKNFGRAISVMAKNGNKIARIIYSRKNGDENYIPLQIRDIIKMLNMAEREVYQAANIAIDEKTSWALDQIAVFMKNPAIRRIEENEPLGRLVGRRRAVSRGDIADFASMVLSSDNGLRQR